MAARASGTGTITFGLVSVPVKVYAATSSKSVSFNMLHDKDKARVKQQLVCSLCGEVVERNQTCKGFEHAKEQYVVIDEGEIQGLLKKTDQTIEINEFIPMDDVDPVYFEKSQWLGPDKGGHKPYQLLLKAMTKSGKVAVGRFSTRGKEQLVVLRPAGEGIMMHGLFYHDEVRTVDDIDVVADKPIKDAELDLAVQLIEQLSNKKFEPQKYKDDYREQVLAIVERKVAGQEVVAPTPDAPREQIIDLVEALKASLLKKNQAAGGAANAGSEEKPGKQQKAG